MTTSTDRQRLFNAWAYHYDTAPGSRAEQAAYEALSLADVDRRGRSQTTNLHGATPTSTPLPVSQSLRGATLPVGPRQRFRLRLLQLRAALRHLHPRVRLFASGLLLFVAGWALLYAALHPTPTVTPDMAALPGLVLYGIGFVAMLWAVCAPTDSHSVSQEETHG